MSSRYFSNLFASFLVQWDQQLYLSNRLWRKLNSSYKVPEMYKVSSKVSKEQLQEKAFEPETGLGVQDE